MLKLSSGYKVTEIDKLHEGYMVSSDYSYAANVDANKTADVLYHFIAMHREERMFFILELPVNLNREDIISPGVINEDIKMFTILMDVRLMSVHILLHISVNSS